MEASDTEGKKEGCLGGCKDILGFSAAKRKEEEIAAKKADLRKNVVMTEHLQPLGELMAKLNSDPVKGLTQEAADLKLEQDGLNRLTPPPEDPAWLKFIRELTGFFSCLLWFGGALCFIGYALRADKETLYLGIVLCLVVFITGCFSFYQNSKSEDLMKSFKNLLPPQVSVIRSGDIMQMDSSNLVAGDVIRLKAGDLVPADVRIIECSDDMCVDNAALTGEAEPQKRKPICQAHLTDRHALEAANLAFFGTLVPEGSCTGVVIMTGDRTILGRIARLAMSTDDDSQTPIGIEIEAFVQFISGIAIGLGLLFFFIGVAIGTDWISNMIYMIGIIVANVPEGLLATVTMSLTLTSQRMAKRKVLVKNLESVETLGSTSCICSDKTGTLTQNNMTVVQIAYHNNSQFSELDVASSYTRFNKGYDSDCPAFQEFCRCAALCNSAIFDAASKIDLEGNPIPASSIVQTSEGVAGSKFNWKAVGNASECAIIKFIQSDVYDEDNMRARYPLRFCIPFNSTNKFQVNICRCNDIRGSNFILNMKGAPERILDRCDTYFAQDGSIKPLSKELRQQITNVASSLAENGLRVIGFAESLLGLEFSKDYAFNDGSDDGFTSHNFPIGYIRPAVFTVTPKPHPNSLKKLTYLGFVGMIDPPRVGVIEAVAKCKSAGIKVIMVTGDHPLTAEAIAHKVGILWSKTRSQMERENERFDRLPGDDGFQDPDNAKAIVVNGEELDGPEMNQSKWDFVLEHPQIVFARTSPQQKLAIVEQVQKFGHIVAVTGDGVNDSPALKQADIGIAMGISGSEVSKQAADMILLDDNFASIVGGVEQGRRVFDNLKKTIVYVLTSNVPELIPFLAYAVMRIPLALTTVLILAIDLGTDMVPAISMAWEDAEADIMTRPPRNSKVDRLVTSRLVWYAYLQTGLVETLGGFLAWFVILNDYGYPPHILIGLGFGSDWGKAPLYCRTVGGVYVNEAGDVSPLDRPSPLFPLWHDSEDGLVIDCAYPARVIESGVGSRKSFEVDDASSYNQYPLQTEGFSQYSIESIEALEASGYYQYIPYRSRMSPFWRSEWLSFDTSQEEAPGGGLGGALPVIYYGFQPAGVWSVCINNELLENSVSSSDDVLSYATYGDFVNIAADANVAFSACDSNDPDVALDSWRNTLKEGHQWTRGVFCNGNNDNTSACEAFDNNALVNVHYCPSGCGLTCLETEEWMNSSRSIDTDSYPQCLNIASRMAQKEALHHSQTGFFVAIVVIQWSNLLVCKTRISSLMSTNLLGNEVMLIGLFFETLLTAWLCYCLPLNIAIGTRNLKFIHWFPGLVWSLILLVYDEGRKFLMRMLAIERVEAATGQIQRSPSWVEKFTYY